MYLGAKANYLHSVLHDWDDDTCCNILAQLASAIRKRGYSKFLIVVLEVVALWSVMSMDWLKLALGPVRECTEKKWRLLLESAGLDLKTEDGEFD